jgi:hypothetical protein
MSDTDHFVSAISQTATSELDFMSAVGDDDFDLVSPSADSSELGDEFDVGDDSDPSDAEGWANFSHPRQ